MNPSRAFLGACLPFLVLLGACSNGGGKGVSTASRGPTRATPAATTTFATTTRGTTTPATTAPATTASPAATTPPAAAKPVLVIVGLEREEKIASGPNVVVVVSASDTALLRQRLAALNAQDYRAVVSFGVSGGLLPGLKVGDLELASQVVGQNAPSGPWAADATLNAKIASLLAAGGVNAPTGLFVGADDLALNNGPAAKAALRAATGADSCDMESHVAAAFAASAKIPFVAIRSPSDDSTQTLPPAALVPLLPNGATDYWAVGLSILKDPGQVPDLIQVFMSSEAAFKTLEKVRQLVDLGSL